MINHIEYYHLHYYARYLFLYHVIPYLSVLYYYHSAFHSQLISYHFHYTNLGEEATWNVVGGTAITLDENLGSHKVSEGYGTDKEKLGRWMWIRVRGKNEVHTRFVSAYKPCKNIGLGTVWT